MSNVEVQIRTLCLRGEKSVAQDKPISAMLFEKTKPICEVLELTYTYCREMLMEIIPDSGGEKTNPIKANLPTFDRKLQAQSWKSWIPAFAGMTAGTKGRNEDSIGCKVEKTKPICEMLGLM